MGRYMSQSCPPNQGAAIHPYQGRRLRRVKNPNLDFAGIPGGLLCARRHIFYKFQGFTPVLMSVNEPKSSMGNQLGSCPIKLESGVIPGGYDGVRKARIRQPLGTLLSGRRAHERD
jgi:hypothetical protein